MRFQNIAGALALAGSSAAFSDSTPWVVLSTSTFPDAPLPEQIQTNAQALENTKDILLSCPTDRYLIASQPGVNAADLNSPTGCTVPHLCRAVEDSRNQGKYFVSEVLGDVSQAEISEYIRTACSKQNKEVDIDEISLSALASPKTSSLAENDALLGEHLDTLMKSDSYTIIYVGTQGEPNYEAEFGEPLRTDLKRWIPVRREENSTEWNKLPLFEKYQFFTPGIFMGILVAAVLFSILGVGLSALSSLEVSYGAFDKDMGPSAQKKQQ